MVLRNKKKAAIEMSLNLIIMLIIGMVILGLVIGFVNSLVGKGTQSFDRQLNENEKVQLDNVKSSSDNLAINPYPSIKIKKGSNENVFIKVRAYKDDISISPGSLTSSTTGLVLSVVKDTSSTGTSSTGTSSTGTSSTGTSSTGTSSTGTSSTGTSSTGTTSANYLTLSGPGFDVKNGKDEAEMYVLKVADSTDRGTYYLKFTLYGEESKTLTVNVE